MIGSAHNNFREILKLAKLSSSRNSRELKPREYYQIYSSYDKHSDKNIPTSFITLSYMGILHYWV